MLRAMWGVERRVYVFVCACVWGVSWEPALTPHSQSARAQPAACQWPHKRDDVMLSQ